MNNLLTVVSNQNQQDLFTKMNSIVGMSFEYVNKEEYSKLSKKDEHVTKFITAFQNSKAICW